MPRFLHTADWQIGRQYATFDPDIAPLLAEARFAAVERLAQLATEHQVDAVLVAGDVFDAQSVSERTLRRLFGLLNGYAGPWLLLPGNHDAALAESVWTRAQRLGCIPGHVKVLTQPQVLCFEAQGFAVLPAPLTQRQTHEDLTLWMDEAATPPHLLRIGLAHGSVQGLLHEGIDSPNPIAPDRAERARLDWLALGDWHGVKQVDARTAYSGTPEPDRFPRNEPGHALLVDIAAPGAMPQVQVLATAQYRWRSLSHTVQVDSDVESVEELLRTVSARDVVDLALEGQVDWSQQTRLQQAVAQAQARARSLRCDFSGLRLLPSDADLAELQADGYVGELLAELRDETAQGDPRSALALHLLASTLQEVRQTPPPRMGAAASPDAARSVRSLEGDMA